MSATGFHTERGPNEPPNSSHFPTVSFMSPCDGRLPGLPWSTAPRRRSPVLVPLPSYTLCLPFPPQLILVLRFFFFQSPLGRRSASLVRLPFVWPQPCFPCWHPLSFFFLAATVPFNRPRRRHCHRRLKICIPFSFFFFFFLETDPFAHLAVPFSLHLRVSQFPPPTNLPPCPFFFYLAFLGGTWDCSIPKRSCPRPGLPPKSLLLQRITFLP